MLLFNRKTPRSYGELRDFTVSEAKKKVTRTTREVTFPASHGLQILEVQCRILGFLLTSCQLLLRDHDLSSIALVPSQPARAMPSQQSFSIASLAVEASYRVPQKLDLKRLKVIVKARVEAAEDHIWSLREDPGYFAQQMKEWAEHSPSLIPDKFKLPHGCAQTPRFYAVTAAAMISNAYGSIVMWHDTLRHLEELCRLNSKLGLPVEPTQRLHSKFETAFRDFDRLTHEMRHWPLNELAAGFCATPTIRGHYVRQRRQCKPGFHDVDVVHELSLIHI